MSEERSAQPRSLSEERSDETKGDLRILTPGLTEEEIAAVTSVVATMIEEQRDAAERDGAREEARWRRSVGAVPPSARGAAAWRWSAR